MDQLPLPLRRYIAGMALSALVAGTLALGVDGAGLTSGTAALAGLLAVAIALAGRFPLHLTDKTKVAVDGGFLVAAALLLPPATAMVVAAAGVFAAQVARRASRAERAFNPAQAALAVGAGSTLCRLAASDRLASALAVLLAAALMHGLNTLLVALAGALQDGRHPLACWREIALLDLPEQALLAGVGVLLAVAATREPAVALALVLVPAVVYAGLRVCLGRSWVVGVTGERAAAVPR